MVPVAVARNDELQGPVARRQLVGDPGHRRRGRVDGDGLARTRVGEHVDVGRERTDDTMELLHGRAARRSGRLRSPQAVSSLVFMQSKVWPIILLAVPSIRRAPTLAIVPAMFTSADQSIVVPPPSASFRAIRASASTALPGAWPWALIVAAFGASRSTNSRFTTK